MEEPEENPLLKYKIFSTIGDGTYGSVQKAMNTRTNELVAIKRMKKKFFKWEVCAQLKEIKALIHLSHPNIVRLHEVIRRTDNHTLLLVFEYLDANVYQLMKSRRKLFNEPQVRNIMYQTLQGLAYMHAHNLFHRDLKPENLLCEGSTDDPAPTIKIADFGLAKEINAKPPFTDYVSTRWYRAPQILLRAPDYNAPIDIFAMGAIMAELFTMKPLFPGSSQLDQIQKICHVLGTPSKVNWEQGFNLAQQIGFTFPRCLGVNLAAQMPTASPQALDLLSQMLHYDPRKRPTAAQCLEHKFFQVRLPIPISVGELQPQPSSQESKEPAKQDNLEMTLSLNKMRSQQEEEELKPLEKTQTRQKQISSLEMMRKARYKPGMKVSVNSKK